MRRVARRARRVAFAVVVLLVSVPALTQDLEKRVSARTLPNGLTVLIVERHEAPVFSTVYGFKVGSVDEMPGITGTAHLFEHMAFKGTPRIGTRDYAKELPIMEESNRVGRELSIEAMKGVRADEEKIKKLRAQLEDLDKRQKQFIVKDEIDQIYNNAGGVGLNASTGTDVTQYYISLPSNRLELFCLVESERMKNAVLREFYTERSVIQEERKQTTEAVPQRMLNEMFMAAAFMAHPYSHPVVGWASDINSVTLEEATAFKKKYYGPGNCVLVIVGDVNPQSAWPLIEKYFGDIPSGDPPPVIRTAEPKQLGERRVRLEFAAEPIMYMGFHKPTFPSKEDAAAQILANILTMGRTGRLYKDLVRDRQIAVSVGAGSSPGSRYDNLLTFSATPRSPHTNEELEKAILEHLDKLKTEPVSERELQKVKNNIEANYLRSMASNQGLGITLLRYQLLFGDWKLYLKAKDALNAVTADDIMRFARTYLGTDNKTVAYLVRKAQ